jgi:MFS family permease
LRAAQWSRQTLMLRRFIDLPAGSLRGLPGRLIVFGLLTTFASSVGQTFFIALSNNAFRDAYGLSSSELSLLYGGATMTSAVFMLGLGRLVDRIDLRLFTAVSAVILAGGALLVSTGTAVAGLAVGLLLLRLGGQGLLSHTAAVAATRTEGHKRGKATSLALLGHALGEAVLPIAWTVLVGALFWQTGWIAAAVLLLAAYLPLALSVLPPTVYRVAVPAGGQAASGGPVALFAERSFLPLLLCAILPGTVVTAAVFHLQPLAATLPPDAPDPAVAIPALAVGAVAGGLAAGVLVDRFGGRRILVATLIPLTAGCVAFAIPGSFAALFIGLAGMGASAGFVHAASAPAWAELYGVGHVGRARSVQAFSMVAGTAVAPVLYGLALDAGVATATVMLFSAIISAAGLALGTMAVRAPLSRRPP